MRLLLQRASRARRGFALVFALAVLALLMTFLIAAQGSVVVQGMEARRRTSRDSRAALWETALRGELARARAGQLDTRAQPMAYSDADTTVTVSFISLTPDHSVYSTSKYLHHRPGDRLVTLAPSSEANPSGAKTSWTYLLNPDRATPVFEVFPPEVKAP